MLILSLLLGCRADAPDAPPTWSADVAPIVARSCVGCHAVGQLAPFPLETYADAADWAEQLAASAEDRTMPPWGAASDCNTPSTASPCRS